MLEIGSQLGFFGFTALALGAKRVVGLDLNPRFVSEANKIAIHYKTLCGWESDRARFRTHSIDVGETFPENPDIIVANSIVHWFFIHGRKVTLREVFTWLRDNVNYALYFEGCVTADETIMKQHKVDIKTSTRSSSSTRWPPSSRRSISSVAARTTRSGSWLRHTSDPARGGARRPAFAPAVE